jgi:hypothetical protein
VVGPISVGSGVSFKYYLYISDAKIDMLLSQIDPGPLRKLATELGIDLKLISVKRVSEPSASDRRTAQLELVVQHLLKFGDVGSVAEPGQFFTGLLPMRWGPFPAESSSSLVFFGGRVEGTTVGLGGSVNHLLGSIPDAKQHGITVSHMPPMLDALGVNADLEDEYVADAVDADLGRGDGTALATVHNAVISMRWPAQNVEFVAKRLLHGDDPRSGQPVLLGSPLYVALVD